MRSAVEPVETTARQPLDLQWLALAWYGQTVEWLCRSQGLARLSSDRPPGGRLGAVPGVTSGHVAAAAPECLGEGFPWDRAVVVGGPCIGDCMRFPTLEALYDSVQTLLVARAVGAPALLYLGDREESLETGSGDKKWAELAGRFAGWLQGLAEVVGLPRLVVVPTSSPEHEAALAALGSGSPLAAAALAAAFHLGNGSPPAQSDGARQVTERVIAAHLPAVVGRHLGERGPAPVVVIAENLQQAGVFRLARTWAEARAEEVGFVGFWPAPGMSAERRMYRSDTWSKVPAWELLAVIEQALPGLQPPTRAFFATWLEPELARAVAAAARAW